MFLSRNGNFPGWVRRMNSYLSQLSHLVSTGSDVCGCVCVTWETSSCRECSKECRSLWSVPGLAELTWQDLTSGSCLIFPSIWTNTYKTRNMQLRNHWAHSLSIYLLKESPPVIIKTFPEFKANIYFHRFILLQQLFCVYSGLVCGFFSITVHFFLDPMNAVDLLILYMCIWICECFHVCFFMYLLTISKKLMQLVGGSKHLCSGLHELQQIRPGLVQSVLPFCNGGGIRMTAVNHFIHHFVNGIHLFLAHWTRLRWEPSKALL